MRFERQRVGHEEVVSRPDRVQADGDSLAVRQVEHSAHHILGPVVDGVGRAELAHLVVIRGGRRHDDPREPEVPRDSDGEAADATIDRSLSSIAICPAS